MADYSSVVAIYNNHNDAEATVKELQLSGFDMKKLSIVAKEYHREEHVVGFYNTGNRMATWGKYGAFWGWIWGILFGSAFMFVPGLGPIMVAGPLVAWIVGALETAAVVGGLSALGGALVSVGIPKDSVLKYETAIKSDKFVVIAHGTREDVEKAKSILNKNASEAPELHQELAVVYISQG